MIINFNGQFINLLVVGVIKKSEGWVDNQIRKYSIVIIAGSGSTLTEFIYDTLEERDKSYDELSKIIYKTPMYNLEEKSCFNCRYYNSLNKMCDKFQAGVTHNYSEKCKHYVKHYAFYSQYKLKSCLDIR